MKTDNGRAVWTAVREIAVNTPPSAMAASNVAGLEGVSVQKSDKIVRINRVMETHKMKPGEFISLQLEGPTDATWLEVNLERDDVNSWAEVELDVEGSAKPVVQKLDKQGKNFIARRTSSPRESGHGNWSQKRQGQDIVLTCSNLTFPRPDPRHQPGLPERQEPENGFSRADKPLDVIVPNLDNPKAANGSRGRSGQAFAIQARRGEGSWTPVGKRNVGPGVSEFAIPAGTTAVRLTYKAPQPDAIINEVIFSPGNSYFGADA